MYISVNINCTGGKKDFDINPLQINVTGTNTDTRILVLYAWHTEGKTKVLLGLKCDPFLIKDRNDLNLAPAVIFL